METLTLNPSSQLFLLKFSGLYTQLVATCLKALVWGKREEPKSIMQRQVSLPGTTILSYLFSLVHLCLGSGWGVRAVPEPLLLQIFFLRPKAASSVAKPLRMLFLRTLSIPPEAEASFSLAASAGTLYTEV